MFQRLACSLIAVFALLAGCPAPGVGSAPGGMPEPGIPTRAVKIATDSDGISGLDRDGDGRLLLVPERQRRVLQVGLDGAVGAGAALQGVPAGVDTEAVAWLGKGELALGLESPREGITLVNGKRCDVGLARRQGEGPYRLEGCLPLPLERWGMEPRPNRGVEGICHVGGTIAAALETVQERSGQRLAPLGLYNRTAGTWRAFSLRLTSNARQKGKVSGLHCEPAAGGGLLVTVIERHFEVRRLVLYRLPPTGGEGGSGQPPVLEPARVVDLDQAALGGPNPEGLVRLDRERWAIVNDNHFGRRDGGTFLSVLRILPPLE